MPVDLRKLLTDVFGPQAGEVVVVACDLPRSADADTEAWRERRAMAQQWRDTFAELGEKQGFRTLPLLCYGATGANNAELPSEGLLEGRPVPLKETLLSCTLACFLTEYSATAPLDGICQQKADFRAASMPGVQKRMEQTALAADYREVARRCRILEHLMRGAEGLDVSFSSGHRCYFDLRFRTPEMDDGSLPRFKPGERVINLPSGETFIVPYEGEREGEPSKTQGALPMDVRGERVVLRVEANRIVAIDGTGPQAEELRAYFGRDPARRNIAEVAFGCNDKAVVTGVVLEDEKAGFHWAFGRSDHLGGTVGPGAFASQEHVVHQDVVYARESPIQVAEATLVRPEGRARVITDGRYVVF